ncbi:MAG: hypothetical protein GC164_11535 [Phycisphaera sp.]|nr:hypothetical protein [Phycisphaera sp.]
MEVPQEAVLFDALRADSPTELFGPCLEGDSVTLASEHLQAMAALARSQIAEVFGDQIGRGGDGVDGLDRIIADMWDTGWSPASGDLNVFSRDFGVVLAAALLELPHAVAVFRSQRVLDHMSVWLPQNGLEVFPFHKALKCLRDKVGESMGQLYRSVALTA